MKIDLPLHSPPKQQSKKVDSGKFIPPSVKKIAQDYEAQFAELMLQEMQKTAGLENMDTSQEFYQSLLQKEQAQKLASSSGGLGIQKMILDQVYPEKFRTESQLEAFEKASRPKKAGPAIKQDLKGDITPQRIELQSAKAPLLKTEN